MTVRKNGLSTDRHHAIGLELARMRDRLTELSSEIMNSYAKSSRLYRLAGRVANPVDDLRYALDSSYFTEHPDATRSPYYPPQDLRRASADHEPHVVGHMPFHDQDLWCCAAHAEQASSR